MATLDVSTSTEVPSLLPVAIAGHAYQTDPAGVRRDSVQMLRQQADTTDLPSEQSLNPQGPWLRSQESWHHGAGQTFFDGRRAGDISDPERFSTSTGIDVWTRGQITLHNATVKVYTEVGDIREVLAVGNYVYLNDNQTLYWSLNPTTTGAVWTSSVIHAGQGAQAITSIATNGSFVWAAVGSSGLHRTTAGAATSTADVPSNACELVGYALGRLLMANGTDLFEVVNPISAPVVSLLHTHQSSDFQWAGIAPGRNCIYAWGNVAFTSDATYRTVVGTGAYVYRITLENTTTALGAPTIATYLPDGETLNNLTFYAGGIILATNKGVRIGVSDAQGNIDYGPLLAGGATPIVAIEPQSRYAWVSGQGYGLARVDLGHLVDNLTPAYAADLEIAPANANPGVAWDACSVATGESPCFTWSSGSGAGTNGHGIYRKTTTKVASGTLETGQIRYGTSASKTLRWLTVRHLPLPAGATVGVEVKRDGGSYVSVGTSSGTGTTTTTFDVGSLACEVAEIRLTLNRATDTTTGPTLLRWTLEALPTPKRYERFTIPIQLKSSVTDGDGNSRRVDVAAEITHLRTLWLDGTVFTLQMGAESHSAKLDDFHFEGEAMAGPDFDTNGYGPRRHVQGTYVAVIQTVD